MNQNPIQKEKFCRRKKKKNINILKPRKISDIHSLHAKNQTEIKHSNQKYTLEKKKKNWKKILYKRRKKKKTTIKQKKKPNKKKEMNNLKETIQ